MSARDSRHSTHKVSDDVQTEALTLLNRLRGKPSHWIHLFIALLWWRLLHGAANKRYKLQSMFTLMSTVVPSELSTGCVGFLHFSIVFGAIRALYSVHKEQATRSQDGNQSRQLCDSVEGLKHWQKVLTQVPPLLTMATAVNAFSSVEWSKMAYSILGSKNTIKLQFEKQGIPCENLQRTSLPQSILDSCTPWKSFKVPSSVKLFRNIPYWKPRRSDRPLKLDIYVPNRVDLEKAPVFMYIHGGGWVFGDKKYASRDLLHTLAEGGWVVVSVQYRLTPKVAWPFHLLDCKRALIWIKTYIQQYGGNPDIIAVGGDSAGGHIAAMMAITGNDLRYQTEHPFVDTTLTACVDLYGIMDLTDSHFFYRAKDPSHGMKKLSQNVLRKKFPRNRPEFVRASPFWLVQGSNIVARQIAYKGDNEAIESLERGISTGGIDPRKGAQIRKELEQQSAKVNSFRSAIHGLVPPMHRNTADKKDCQETEDLRETDYSQKVLHTDDQHEKIADYETASIPPFIVIHGMLDTLVPVEDGILFWNALQCRRRRDIQAWNAYLDNDMASVHSHISQFCPEVDTSPLSPEKCDRQALQEVTEHVEVTQTLKLPSTKGNDEFHEDVLVKSKVYAPNPVPDVCLVLPGAHHAFNYNPSYRTHAVSRAVLDFLNRVVNSSEHENSHVNPKL